MKIRLSQLKKIIREEVEATNQAGAPRRGRGSAGGHKTPEMKATLDRADLDRALDIIHELLFLSTDFKVTPGGATLELFRKPPVPGDKMPTDRVPENWPELADELRRIMNK